jgi:hypothetical protein
MPMVSAIPTMAVATAMIFCDVSFYCPRATTYSNTQTGAVYCTTMAMATLVRWIAT